LTPNLTVVNGALVRHMGNQAPPLLHKFHSLF
jgi:hypothetical protein